jgi:hypothetical protein
VPEYGSTNLGRGCKQYCKSVLDVVKSRQELFLSLKRFKACLSYIIGGSSMKGNLQKVQGKKGEQACQGALDLADRFLEDPRF